MKIFTLRGDQGESGLLSGERARKDDLRFQAVGALDELQSCLGVVRALTGSNAIGSMVHSIQKDLFLAGSELASSAETLAGLKGRLGREDILGLEERIDQLTDRYGLPGHFVVPGESFESAFLHVARAVCRRCERSIVTLNAEQDGAHRTLIAYFNRLGDLLFVLAWALEVRTVVRRILEETLAHQPYREGTE